MKTVFLIYIILTLVLMALLSHIVNSASCQPSQDTIVMAMLTDIHYQPNFNPAGDTSCHCINQNIGKSGCAANSIPGPTPISVPKCDSSSALVDAAIYAASAAVGPVGTSNPSSSPSFLLLLGDLNPHNLANLPGASDLAVSYYTSVATRISKAFSNVVPVLGNNDLFPKDNGTPANRLLIANHWQSLGWIDGTQKESILSTGCYIAIPAPGLRVITLNMVNLTPDPDGSLSKESGITFSMIFDFFQQALEDAAIAGDIVIIAGHEPPTFDFWDSANSNEIYYKIDPSNILTYNRLVTKYSNIIVAQMFSHQHWGFFNAQKDPVTNEIYGFFNANSGVIPKKGSSSDSNPSFRVYNLQRKITCSGTGSTSQQSFSPWHLMKWDEYIMDLMGMQRGNAFSPNNQFSLQYSSDIEYGISPLTPSSWEGVLSKLKTDDNFLARFWWNDENRIDTLSKVEKTIKNESKKWRPRLFCAVRCQTKIDFTNCVDSYTTSVPSVVSTQNSTRLPSTPPTSSNSYKAFIYFMSDGPYTRYILASSSKKKTFEKSFCNSVTDALTVSYNGTGVFIGKCSLHSIEQGSSIASLIIQLGSNGTISPDFASVIQSSSFLTAVTSTLQNDASLSKIVPSSELGVSGIATSSNILLHSNISTNNQMGAGAVIGIGTACLIGILLAIFVVVTIYRHRTRSTIYNSNRTCSTETAVVINVDSYTVDNETSFVETTHTNTGLKRERSSSRRRSSSRGLNNRRRSVSRPRMTNENTRIQKTTSYRADETDIADGLSEHVSSENSRRRSRSRSRSTSKSSRIKRNNQQINNNEDDGIVDPEIH